MEFGQIHHVEYYVNDLASSNEFWSWFSPHENNRQGNGLNHIAFMGGTTNQLNELVI